MSNKIVAETADTHRERVRKAFLEPGEFTTSPLYRALSRTVAAEPGLLDLASLGRPGQYPTFLFFGAVHRLLLAGAEHPLAGYFPSVTASPGPAEEAGPALVSFCAAHRTELAELISTRLVQTNQVQRALGLRIGLAAIAEQVAAPVHLIEVGASAGLNLRYDRYGYRLGGRVHGDPGSPVQLVAEQYGSGTLPDLDALPALASVLGVDLNPIDVRDAGDRAWLEALVWPENHDQRRLLTAALDLVAADPPEIRAGTRSTCCRGSPARCRPGSRGWSSTRRPGCTSPPTGGRPSTPRSPRSARPARCGGCRSRTPPTPRPTRAPSRVATARRCGCARPTASPWCSPSSRATCAGWRPCPNLQSPALSRRG